MRTMAVAEIFGPTFQGEGPSLGKRVLFLRLSGCNLACTWCDTPYTWDWTGKNGKVYDAHEETQLMSTKEVGEALGAIDRDAEWVISGGEPMLQDKAIRELLRIYGGDVEIETNGTIDPRMLVESVEEDRPGSVNIIFNVSPKLLHSGNGMTSEKYLPIYRELGGRFKFVCQDVEDLEEVQGIVDRARIPRWQVYIMPEGRQADGIQTTAQALADEVLNRRWNLTTRLHVQLWGDKRGR